MVAFAVRVLEEASDKRAHWFLPSHGLVVVVSEFLYEARVLREGTVQISCSFYVEYPESVYVVCTSTTVLRK